MAEQSLTTDTIDDFLNGAEMLIITAADAEKQNAKQLASQLGDWYWQERTVQAENRMEMATDAAFYDSDQWTEAEKAELMERNQYPSVINLIKPTIDWLSGTEKRLRTDWRVLPTTPDGDEDAKIKTHVMKFITEASHGQYKRSQAFVSAAKVGVGWRELGVRGDKTDIPIFIGNESWRNILYDSQAKDPMFIEDGRYMFREKIVDLDVALAMLPSRREELKLAALATYDKHWDYINSDIQLYYKPTALSSAISDATTTFHNRRLVVPLIECWYRKPVKVKKIKQSDIYEWGAEYDPNDPEMKAHVDDAGNSSTLYDKVEMRMFVAMFIKPGIDMNRNGCSLLFNARSPYKHQRFPFVPLWAYRKDADNTPYGAVRSQRDAQRDFNKRHSKAQFILSTRGVIYEDGAVDDEDALAEEISRPDFMIKRNKGFELEISDNNSLAKEHIEIANLDERYIRQASGVTGENLGLSTNATSGVAIERRQMEGAIVTQDLFDNGVLHDQVCGEILLSLIEQFMDLPTQIMISGEKGPEALYLNQPDPQGEGLINDITARKAKFKVTEHDYNATVRQAMFEELMKLIGNLPAEMGMQLLDVVIEMGNMPEREELVRRIRQLNGHSDADDLTEDERKEIEEARDAAQAEQQALEKRAAMAKIEKDEGDAALRRANAAKATVDTSKTNVEALASAIEQAGMMLVVPAQQTQMADSLVKEGRQLALQKPGAEPDQQQP